MKKLLLPILALTSFLAFPQKEFGLKAGLNFDSNGKINFTEIANTAENIIEDEGSARTGFHIGGYAKFHITSFYIRPELVFTRTTSEYNVNSDSGDLKVSKIDVPLLLGYKIVGPLSIFAGPSFQYILDNDLDIRDVTIADVDNDLTVGFNIGAGIQLGNLGLDVRYERGFTENEADFIQNNVNDDIAGRIDARPSQLIFSLSMKL